MVPKTQESQGGRFVPRGTIKDICVVSDLHMFCGRSRWQDHLSAIYAAAQEADLFVFNGDTFDFKWTILNSIPDTVRAAIAFLRDFATRNPECQIHVNLGNHDHMQVFIDALDILARETPNLSWHPYYLRLGNRLFLHGDVAQRKMKHRQLERYRSGWLHRKKQGRFKNQVYDAVYRTGAHLAITQLAFPPRRTLKRVSAYLEDIGHDAESGVEHVYFGHTHVRIHGHMYRGLTFHNGGAPLEGVPFSLLKV